MSRDTLMQSDTATLAFAHRLAQPSVAARRLHQREQFVDGALRGCTHAIGVVHAGDVDAANDGFDLVAEVGEEAQGIALLIGHARDQPRNQNLARDQLAVQFVHSALLTWRRRYERCWFW